MGLKSKGLERSSSPDLLVTFETQSKERVYVNNYLPYGWSPFFYQYPYSSGYSRVQGTLYVNFIDSKNQQLIWQGKGVGVLNEYSKDRDKMIGNFVSSILEKFPPTEDQRTLSNNLDLDKIQIEPILYRISFKENLNNN